MTTTSWRGVPKSGCATAKTPRHNQTDPTTDCWQCGSFDPACIGSAAAVSACVRNVRCTPASGVKADICSLRLKACRTENPRLRKHLIAVVPDNRVAFTRDIFDRRAIQELDVTAAIADEAGALQQTGRERDGGAPHSQHLAEKLLRQRDDIAVDAIMRLQQPTAKPGLEGMQRIARHRLLDLRQQQIVVAHNEIANALTLPGGGMKLGGRQPGRPCPAIARLPVRTSNERLALRSRR
jgi:hypothetical protein